MDLAGLSQVETFDLIESDEAFPIEEASFNNCSYSCPFKQEQERKMKKEFAECLNFHALEAYKNREYEKV